MLPNACCWHEPDMPLRYSHVGYRGMNGRNSEEPPKVRQVQVSREEGGCTFAPFA
jgi:hypothetical protein